MEAPTDELNAPGDIPTRNAEVQGLRRLQRTAGLEGNWRWIVPAGTEGGAAVAVGSGVDGASVTCHPEPGGSKVNAPASQVSPPTRMAFPVRKHRPSL
jgi:hypothetical protein